MTSYFNYLLDTSSVIELLRGKELAQVLVEDFFLNDAATRIFISSITKGELNPLEERFGDKKKSLLDQFYKRSIEIPPSIREIVNEFANINIKCRKFTVGQNDLWIAATANYLNIQLITCDKDFVLLSKLGLLKTKITLMNKETK